MPGDAGPMAFYYNSKLLAKYHITPPTTWAQFATDAASAAQGRPVGLHDELLRRPTCSGCMSLMAQDNAWPFTYTGGSNGRRSTGPARPR